ncbi:hypothetical protein COW46_05630 [Candidatus Gracilibacteria bacterium CG17_big_fil_post_rev_8_21_14_2_50_48_13]|nr:MAG: hypothetical protein COW46_05630 [Candidatus Gracilibacteria bacterium CG17_big_fil_post_rev_8_21_14_2_50_48_13]
MERKFRILKAIIESFIVSAEPVGSKFLLEKMDMDVSPATIRNDMSWLEKHGLLYQPYTSAGRVPTTHGFRMYVDELMGESHVSAMAQGDIAVDSLKRQVAEDRIYYAVSLLARTCGGVSFATIPPHGKAYYLGLSNILQTPEFTNSMEASTVVKVLEDQELFLDLLHQLPIDDEVRVFIGEENILPEIQSCSLIAVTFSSATLGDGILGILGPKRMNYAFNMAALNHVRSELSS